MILDSHNHIGYRKGEYFAVEEVISWMDKAGIDKIVVFTQCETPDNIYVAKAMQKYPDRLIGFAYSEPWEFTAEEELYRCFTEYNMKGLKLNPTKQSFALDRHDLVDILFKICEKKNCPIVSHGASDIFNMPNKFAAMARQFPGVNLIMAHMGLPDAFDSALRLVKSLKNLYLDTAGVDPQAIKKAIKEVGPEKILMGSDTPWGRFELSIHAVEAATSDKSARELIMGGNLQRLLNLS